MSNIFYFLISMSLCAGMIDLFRRWIFSSSEEGTRYDE